METIESAKYVVLGNVDAGKSSLIGVLEKNVLDDGNGYARTLTAKYKHEQESGRTSSQTSHYIVNNGEVVTLVDLCGHEKYLKTTMSGITGSFADYGIMVIGSNMGMSGMSAEHISLLVTNRIPFIIVITKIDICPPNILSNTKKELEKIIKKSRKEIVYFDDLETEIDGSYIKDTHRSIIELFQEGKNNIVPVIMVSNKSGYNINFLKELIISIRSKSYLITKGLVPPVDTTGYPSIMYIDSTFNVPGIGIVLSGVVKHKSLTLGQKVYVGPINGKYIQITIKTMKNCISEDVKIINPDQSGSIGIRLGAKHNYTRESFSKGQIVTDDYNFALKNTCNKFNCDVAIFNHPTTIRNGYETVMHCRTIRQTCKFKIDDDIILRSNCKHNISVRFKQRPEFILPGLLFVFRDGRTKGIGKIISCTSAADDTDNMSEMSHSHNKTVRILNRENYKKIVKDTLN